MLLVFIKWWSSCICEYFMSIYLFGKYSNILRWLFKYFNMKQKHPCINSLYLFQKLPFNHIKIEKINKGRNVRIFIYLWYRLWSDVILNCLCGELEWFDRFINFCEIAYWKLLFHLFRGCSLLNIKFLNKKVVGSITWQTKSNVGIKISIRIWNFKIF